MSLLDTKLTLDKSGKIDLKKNILSPYNPSQEIRDRLALIRSDFTSGYTTLQRPRREFNDLALIERTAIDQMAWAVYQPNDGDNLDGNVNGWRSNAVRPIVRNKVFSIAAHVTARTLFPRIVAFDEESKEQEDAAQVMSDLIEWSSFNTNATFADVSLQAVISALVNPVSLVWTEYVEVYRTVKRKKTTDGWIIEKILDEDMSGFRDESLPPDQLYIQDFYQPDIQKQGWIIRRRVRPYTLLNEIYGSRSDWQYVRSGVQCIFNDANQQFYEAYDLTMRQDECEEVIYLNKSLDLRLEVVNGVLLTDSDNPNPREDKLYPCASFGYEYLRANGDCFYWKSLAFKTMPDDKIVNTLYPMIIDGTYLAIMPPMINRGGEIIGSDVIVPGGVTTFSNPDASLDPIAVQNDNLKAGLEALMKVEQNIQDDAFNSLQQGDMPDNGGNMPAYNMSKMEQNAKIMLGPFMDMVGRYVKQMGRLRIGDIKQYMTLPQIMAIEGSANQDLVYKNFLLPQAKHRSHGRRIKFDLSVPEEQVSGQDHLNTSMDILDEEGGIDSKNRLYKVNPRLFRNMKYMCIVSPDVLSPMSEELEASWDLTLFDRMVQAPTLFDPEETAKLLLKSSPTTRKHPEDYIAKNPALGPAHMPANSEQPNPTQMTNPQGQPVQGQGQMVG